MFQVEEELTDNVYELVSNDEYGRRVQERQEEGFIVEDGEGHYHKFYLTPHSPLLFLNYLISVNCSKIKLLSTQPLFSFSLGMYKEDGREIFDEEYSDEEGYADKDSSKKGPAAKRKAKERAKKEQEAKRRGNIKNMILSMPSKRKAGAAGEDKDANLDGDDVLEGLLGQIKGKKPSSAASASNSAAAKRKAAERSAAARAGGSGAGSSNPFAKRSTGIRKPRTTTPLGVKNPERDGSSALDLIEADDDDEPMEYSATQDIEDVDENGDVAHEEDLGELLGADDDFEIEEAHTQDASAEVKVEVKQEPEVTGNRGFHQKDDKASEKKDLSKWTAASATDFVDVSGPQVEVNLESGELPLTTNKNGEKVLRMYWLDAFEDPYKVPGTVWLFGKVYVEKAKTHVSCCLRVNNIPRRVFLLKRETR